MRPPRLSLSWWVLAVLGLGAVLGTSAGGVGFLSDDYLMVRYWDRDAGAVLWQHVAADFEGPWFGVRDLYRPIVSLSVALQLQLHGADARWFHLANVAMLVVAALAMAGLVRMRLPQGRGFAAFAAGALQLVHPAAVEPSHWIAARTTALEVMFSALAMCAYAAFLYGRMRSRWPAFVAMAFALGSKEGAIMLAVSLTAVDLLCARGSVQARVQGLRPFWVLLAGYLLFRKLALGWFTTAKEGLGAGTVAGGVFAHAAWLLGSPATAWPWLLAPLLAALALPLLLRQPSRALLFAAWFALLLLPASHVVSVGDAYDGRLVYSCMPALGLFCIEAASAWRRGRAPAVLLAALLLACAAASLPLAAQYRAGGAIVREFAQALRAAGARAAPGRPLAPVAFVQQRVPLHVLQTGLWGLLLQRPFAAADSAVAGLDALLRHAGDRPPVDASPAAAVLAAGGTLAEWDGTSLRLYQQPSPLPQPELRAQGGGRFAAQPPLDARGAGVLEVDLPQPARRCSLGLANDLPAEAAFGVQEVAAEDGAAAFWFDLSAARSVLVLQKLGAPWPDFVVRVDGEPAPAATTLRLHRLPAAPDLPAALHGRDVMRAELLARLPRPSGPAMLYLLLPTTVVAAPLGPGATELPPALAGELDFAQALLGHCTVHFFWRTAGGTAAPRRSALDWFTLR